MATVHITDRLISSVRDNIHDMRRAEIVAEHPHHAADCTLDASAIYNEAEWGEHLHLMAVLPKDWLYQVKRAYFYVTGEIEGKPVKMQITVPTMASAYARPGKDRYSLDRAEVTQAALQARGCAASAFILKQLETAAGVAALMDKWARVEKDVIEFLRKCKSLNEAIKLLPNIKLYIPKDDIERVEYKPESTRVRREKLVAEVPVEEITAAAMAARLSGAFA